MKKLNNLLLIAFMLQLSLFCFGQAATLADENGLVFRWQRKDKIDTRYNEYCKAYFDVYSVEGTVENHNKDKAAVINAILSFDGDICNKIYNDNGPSGGEIIKKKFVLDVALKSRHQSQYWVNRYVHLLPNDSMKAYIKVEVLQNEPLPNPEFHFHYDLSESKNTVLDEQSQEVITEDIPETNTIRDNNPNNYTSLIVGNWQEIHRVSNTDGKIQEEDVTESSECGASVLQFIQGGEATEWSKCYDTGSITYESWFIEGKKLIYNSSIQLKSNIYQLNNTILVIKTVFDDNNYIINTYQKFE